MLDFLGYMVFQDNSSVGDYNTYHGVDTETCFAEDSFHLIQKQDCFKSHKKAFELLEKLERTAYEEGIDAKFQIVEICK